MPRPVNDEVKYVLLKGKKISTKKEFHIRTLQIIGTNKQNAHATAICCFEANMTYINNTINLKCLQQGIWVGLLFHLETRGWFSFLFAAP